MQKGLRYELFIVEALLVLVELVQLLLIAIILQAGPTSAPLLVT